VGVLFQGRVVMIDKNEGLFLVIFPTKRYSVTVEKLFLPSLFRQRHIAASEQ